MVFVLVIVVSGAEVKNVDKVKKTSFGSMEKLSLNPLIEKMIFNKEGK